ncbi:KAP family NTPase [Acinetobacter baumannii]|nr:KAP family NTPase [Acinetobacter baumannii]
MNDTDKFGFSADRPIHTVKEDLLGRAKFSENLAEAISNWNGRDSLVVALYGDWGAGKSSVKNMALSYMKDKELKQIIIEFSPWEWAGQEIITKAFYDEISKSIGKQNSSEKYRKLARLFKKYGNYLDVGEVILTSTSSSLPIIVPVIAGIGFFNAFLTDTKVITLLTTGIVAVSPLLKWTIDKIKKATGYLNEKAKESEKNLDEIRNELKIALQGIETPILIVMDDLDRLSSSELRMIFQLIKANTEFPNVTFLLLFQKDIVEEKLSDTSQSGKKYLEKIIQVPFNIPKAEVSKVYQVLFNNIEIILNSDVSISNKFDNKRWGQIFNEGLNKYFKNLRDVYRFTSTLKFHFNLLKGVEVFEVNPVDLIVVECFRVFEPNLYHEIFINKEVFTAFGVSTAYDNGREKERLRDTIKSIINSIDNMDKEIVEKILKNIFPNIKSIISNIYYDYSHHDNWFADGRICHEKNFDQYFLLSLESVEITKSDLERFLTLTENKNLLKKEILELYKKGILSEFLIQFEVFSKRISIDSAKPYMSALLESADLVDENTSEAFTPFSLSTYIYRLFNLFLEKIDNKDERGRLVVENFNENHGLIVIAQLLLSEEKSKGSGDELLFNEKDFNNIKEIFLNKLKEYAYCNSESFISKKSFLTLLYRWRSWGEEKEVVEWVATKSKDIEGMIKILRGMVQTTTSYISGDDSSIINYHIKGDYINDFLGIEKVEKMINNINLSKLSEDDLRVIELAKIGIERKNNNQDIF